MSTFGRIRRIVARRGDIAPLFPGTILACRAMEFVASPDKDVGGFRCKHTGNFCVGHRQMFTVVNRRATVDIEIVRRCPRFDPQAADEQVIVQEETDHEPDTGTD